MTDAVSMDGDSGVEMAHNGSEGSTSGLRKGKCKWFNVNKGWGFITPDDGTQEIFVHQSVINMPGYRSLGEQEEVMFECVSTRKGLEATKVTAPDGTFCRGSNRKRTPRRRFQKIRCYNCGEFANHIAAKCPMEPQPKKCHNCKSADHLIADCPQKSAEPEKPSEDTKDSKAQNGDDEVAGTSSTNDA